MISPARARCTRRSAMLTQSPKATNCRAPIGPAWPNTASPRCCHDRVFHAERAREFLYGAPAGVRVLDVRLGMELEELQIVVFQPEELAPATALEPEPAPLPELAPAVARNVHSLGAGIGD